MLQTTNKNPVIYDALMTIANVDVNEAALQSTRFDNNQSPAIYVARASIYAKKGSGVSFDFFKDDRAKNIPVDYLEPFITSFALFLSKQDAATQQRGIDLMKSDFFLTGPTQEYRRFYLITGLVNHYNVETNATFKAKIKSLIREIFEQEKDSYLREVLESGFPDILNK